MFDLGPALGAQDHCVKLVTLVREAGDAGGDELLNFAAGEERREIAHDLAGGEPGSADLTAE
jgi:hypothetical protein